MSDPPSSSHRFLSLLLLGLAGAVLLRFRAVAPLQPLADMLLVAGWLALFSLACLGAGSLVTRRFAMGAGQSLDDLVLTLGCGAGALALAAFALGAVRLLRPAPVMLVFAASAGLGIWRALKTDGLRPSLPRPLLAPEALALLILVCAATLPALPALSSFYDQWNYHLAFPFQWLRHGGLVVFPRHYFSFYPANGGLLYVYALATLGGWAAQAVHWWLGGLAVVSVFALTRGFGDSQGAWWGAALFATTPSVMVVATLAGSDLAVAAFAGVGWLALSRAQRGPRAGPLSLWLTSGAMAGLAAGSKYTALATVGLPLIAAGVVVALLQRREAGLVAALARPILQGLAAVLSFAPWLVRNALACGNPVHPFLGRVFGSSMATTQGPPTDKLFSGDFVHALTLGTFEPRGHAGVIGPVWLVILPVAVLLALGTRKREALPLVVGLAAGVLGWSLMPQLGRYLLPVLVPAAALGGWALASLVGSWSGALARLLRVFFTALLAWAWLLGLSPQAVLRSASTFGATDNQELLRTYVSHWPAISFINEELPRDAKILLMAEARSYGIERDVLIEAPATRPLMVELANEAASPDELAGRLADLGVTHLLLNLHEAERIAKLTGRATYFGGLTPRGQRNLQGFLEQRTRTILDEPVVKVMTLVEPRY